MTRPVTIPRTTGSRQTSGSLAGLRLCMVMHLGNSGGSRAWQGLLGRRPDWGIDPHPRSTGVRKGSVSGDHRGMTLARADTTIPAASKASAASTHASLYSPCSSTVRCRPASSAFKSSRQHSMISWSTSPGVVNCGVVIPHLLFTGLAESHYRSPLPASRSLSTPRGEEAPNRTLCGWTAMAAPLLRAHYGCALIFTGQLPHLFWRASRGGTLSLDPPMSGVSVGRFRYGC
jgi:hypothetical protein